MATVNNNNGQAGTSRRQAPNPQRDHTLLARMHFHIQALIGQVEEPGKLPRPPTASEKASWNRQASPSGDSEEDYDPFNDPDNKFLWDLAFSLFLKLVRVGEYGDIDLEMTSEKKIYSTLRNHIINLIKKYQRQVSWTPQQSSSCAAQCCHATRRANVRCSSSLQYRSQAQCLMIILFISALLPIDQDLKGGSSFRYGGRASNGKDSPQARK
ncbi:hypothetical protein VP01_1660g13 [Puccinia sorghi]|uniref:Uncharacterized protein n=1 Tax=Puccinia sorghi TaxID=27349 RepID=A0A0L6VG99_9BASI|nr:hypothetical protein VP01_1660g13 [Puccinia sorghi]